MYSDLLITILLILVIAILVLGVIIAVYALRILRVLDRVSAVIDSITDDVEKWRQKAKSVRLSLLAGKIAKSIASHLSSDSKKNKQ